MLHANIHAYRTLASGDESFKEFYHVRTLQPSSSCDQNHFYKFMSRFPRRPRKMVLICQADSEKKTFDGNGHICI